MSKKYLDTVGLNKLVANILSKFAAKNHSHSNATTNSAGFMSSSDKVKLDGVSTGANRTIVDSTLSSTSVNAIQNKAVKAALDGKAASSHTHPTAQITGLDAALAGKASASHKHDAGDITSGVLPIGRGGTGGSSARAAQYNLFNNIDEVYGTPTDDYYVTGTYLSSGNTTNGMLYKMRFKNVWNYVKSKTDPLYQPRGSYAAASHTHSISNITNLQSQLDSKQPKGSYAASSHTHTISNVTNLQTELDKKQVKIQPVTTAGTGSAYTANVPHIKTLTAGMKFTMVPHVVSAAVSPTLNVNNLGAKPIRQRLSNSTLSTAPGATANWLAAGKPVEMMYDGQFWVVDFVRPNMASAYGTLPITNGGTGATTVEQARKNLGIDTYDASIATLSAGVEKANTGVTKLNEDLPVQIRKGVSVIPVSTSDGKTFVGELHSALEIARLFDGKFPYDGGRFMSENCTLIPENHNTKVFIGCTYTAMIPSTPTSNTPTDGFESSMIMATDVLNTGLQPDYMEIAYTYIYKPPVYATFALYTSVDHRLTFVSRYVNHIPQIGEENPFGTPNDIDGVYIIDLNKKYSSREDVPWHDVRSMVRNITFADNIPSPVSMAYWFSGMNHVAYIDGDSFFKKLDTSKTKNMSHTFEGASDIFITEKATSSLDTSSVEDMSYMFNTNYIKASSANIIIDFDTSKCKNMNSMFANIGNNNTINLQSFNTQNVVDMSNMFSTQILGRAPSMNLGGFNRIYVSDGFNTDNVQYSDNMFASNSVLVGGAGTKYDPSHTDKTYARIDNPPSAPGYFTRYTPLR